MPMRVWVRLHQLVGLSPGKYKFWGEIRPFGFPFSANCAYDSATTFVSAITPLELSAGRRYGSTMILTIRTDNASCTEIARLSLPLHWFPAEQTVRDWYPVHFQPCGQLAADIEVHIVKRFSLAPFTAPAGHLLVLPAWNRPDKPAIPPTPFFIGNDSFERLTVAQAPFPMAQPPPPAAPMFVFMPPAEHQMDSGAGLYATPPREGCSPSESCPSVGLVPVESDGSISPPTVPIYPV
jgi:hypothetical protein